MIFLHTGLPGAGKTLFTLAHLKPLAEADARQVYFHGITDCKVPGWVEISEDEALRWYELPPASIIVIDEAQKLFRPRGAAAKVPEHVARLETHRHNGHDLYLITQHPGLIDANVRKLVGTHRHVMRAFGAGVSVVHRWMQCKDSCDKSRKDSIKEQFRYPKEVFDWYKSAEAHTHKRSIPGKLLFLLAVPLIIGVAGWYAYQGLTVGSIERAEAAIANARGVPVGEGGYGSAGAMPTPMPTQGARARPVTVEEYMASYVPRVPGFAHTAPRYDAVTEPVAAPYPAACIEMRGECRCYTDQATRLSVAADVCRSIIERGYFKDFAVADSRSRDRPSIGTGAAPRTDRGSPVVSNGVRPESSARRGPVPAYGSRP